MAIFAPLLRLKRTSLNAATVRRDCFWLSDAEQDRLDIGTRIAFEDPAAVRKMDELFGRMSQGLADFPLRGKPGVVPGTRELLVHRSYKLVYEVEDDHVYILAVVHTARQWPPVAGV